MSHQLIVSSLHSTDTIVRDTAIILLIMICLLETGCDRPPSNPATDLLRDPPAVVDSSIVTTCRVTLEQMVVGLNPIKLHAGQEFTAEIQMTIDPASGHQMQFTQPWVRMLPENSSEADWRAFSVVNQYGIYGNGSGGNFVYSTKHKLRESPGVYDVRVYVFYSPQFAGEFAYWLVKKGKVTIEHAASE